MATHWVILASVVSLALGTMVNLDAKQKQSLSHECCELDKMMPFSLEDKGNCKPVESKELVGKDAVTIAEKICKEVECTLSENGLLNEDKSIKEKELRNLFLEKANADAKTVVLAALDKCFQALNENPEKGKDKKCRSGAELLFTCFTNELFDNCPEQMWNTTKPQCQGTTENKEPDSTKEKKEHKSTKEKKEPNGKKKKNSKH